MAQTVKAYMSTEGKWDRARGQYSPMLMTDAAVAEARRILAETEPSDGSNAQGWICATSLGRAYSGELGGFMAMRTSNVVPALAESLAAFIADDDAQ